jgi:hypothetical protein
MRLSFPHKAHAKEGAFLGLSTATFNHQFYRLMDWLVVFIDVTAIKKDDAPLSLGFVAVQV